MVQKLTHLLKGSSVSNGAVSTGPSIPSVFFFFFSLQSSDGRFYCDGRSGVVNIVRPNYIFWGVELIYLFGDKKILNENCVSLLGLP